MGIALRLSGWMDANLTGFDTLIGLWILGCCEKFFTVVFEVAGSFDSYSFDEGDGIR